MNSYKALFIIDPEREKSLEEIAKGIADTIAAQGGRMGKGENWGRQSLPHAVKKKKEGLFYELDFSIDPSKISGLTNTFKLKPEILRVMITRK